jgi:hypothetical protein
MRAEALKDLPEHPQPQFLPLGEGQLGHFLLVEMAELLQTPEEFKHLLTEEPELTQQQAAVEVLVEA